MQLFGRMKRVRFAVPEDNEVEEDHLVSKESDSFDVEFRQLRQDHRVLKRWIAGLSMLLALALALLLFISVKPEGKGKDKASPIPDCKPTSCIRCAA